MRKGILALLLLAVPLAVAPYAVTFDASKAFLLSLGALLLAAAALERLSAADPRRFDFRWSAPTAAGAAAVLAMAASAAQGPDGWAAARLVALLLAALAVASAVENAVFHPGELAPLLAAAAWAQGLVSAFGLLQAAALGGDPSSTIGNRNWAAEFAAAALPVAVLAAARARGAGRAAAVLGVLLGAGLLVAARGRAALLGAACGAGAGAAVLLLAAGGRRRAAGRALLVGGGLALLGGYGVLLARGGELPGFLGRSDTAVVRVELARATAGMLRDAPLGVGAGNWEAAIPPCRTEKEYRASLFRDPGEAHCEPLQFAAEGGWPAVAALLALAALLVRAAARAARGGGDPGAAAALAGVLAATAGASLLSAPFHRPASLLLFAFAAGGIGLLSGGRLTTLGGGGLLARRVLVGLLGAGTLLLGQRMAAEGPQAAGRRILREEAPLPWERGAEAQALFATAASLDPGAADALAREGETALHLGATAATPEEARARYGAAGRAYGSLLGLRPLDPMALSGRAEAHSRLGEAAAAEAAWREALAIAPWHRNANLGLAAHRVREGKAAEALPLLDRALGADPLSAAGWALRAEAAAALGREGEWLEGLSTALDRLLADPPRDLEGARAVARRASAASPLLAEMVVGKAVRLLGGPDLGGGRAVLEGAAAGRPEEALLDRGARALAGAKLLPEATRMRVDARFAAAEAALESGDRDRAAEEALRAAGMQLSTALSREVRFRAARVLVRAGRREAALAEIGVAVARGWADPEALRGDPAFAPLREDPAFASLVERARANRAAAEK